MTIEPREYGSGGQDPTMRTPEIGVFAKSVALSASKLPTVVAHNVVEAFLPSQARETNHDVALQRLWRRGLVLIAVFGGALAFWSVATTMSGAVIASGQFVVDGSGLRVVGLSWGGSATVPEIEYALRVQGGVAEVREAGAYRSESSVGSGDVLTIAIAGGTTNYLKNGEVFFTSSTPASYPMAVGAILFDMDASVSQALDLAIEQGYSRLPVEGPEDDDVVGIAYTKDMIRAEREGAGEKSVQELVRQVRFVPEHKPVRQLMREMQAGKFHLALVADEYGAISGLVTLEDCLEELVGEIVDEYDEELIDELQRVDDKTWLALGRAHVDEINHALDLNLPEDDDFDTIAGFVFTELGHVPKQGESFLWEGRVRFSVVEATRRRIERVQIEHLDGGQREIA